MKIIEEFSTPFKGRFVFDTKHSVERFQDQNRFPDMASKVEFKYDVLSTINKGIQKILNSYNDKRNEYIIHSKSTGIGVVIDWRADKYSNDDTTNHAFIITILGVRDKPFYKKNPSDIYLIVEKQLYEWAISNINNDNRKVLNEEASYDHTKSIDGFMVSIYEGKYKDCTGTIIIVD